MTSHATPDVHLYLHQPTVLFKARVNMPGTITYPVTHVLFDTVTVGAYTDLAFDMTLVLGTTDGADDLGRTRVQKVATSTAIPVARVSRGVEDGTLTIQDNAYITVYADDFRVWAKLPYQSPDGTDYKDADIAVLDYMTEPPPVVIMGAGTAAYTSGGIITVSFDASASYSTAVGATISTYAWDVKDGTITVGTSASAAITATFPAGFRQVALTVTDSNGKANSSRRPVLAVNAAADVTIRTAQVESQRFTQAGQVLRVRFPADIPRTTYPDGCLVMLWWGAPSSASDRSHMKFIGWHQSDDVSVRPGKNGLVRETILECVDVVGRLETLPAFPQAIQREDEDDVNEQWALMPDATISRVLHYLIFWHSTALGVADFFLPADGNNYPSMRLDTTPSTSTLYNQIDERARTLTPDHIFVCNEQGQMSFLEDWMVVDVGDRPTVAHILTEDEYGDLSMPYARAPRVHVLNSSAVIASTDWVMLGAVKTLPLAFSKAPGEAFGQGTREEVVAEGLTQSQTQLNMVTGHRYARLNARFGPVRVRLLDLTDIWEFVPALMQRIQFNIAATYAAQRGLPFTTTQAMAKELNIRYQTNKQGLAIEAEATLELETSGPPAVTHVPETQGDPADYETPPIPPPTQPPPGLETGVQQVAGIGIDGYVYRTSNFQTASGSGGPTWDRVNLSIASTIYSWVVDPFSPGYINGTGTINGWIANDTNIYRVTDLFGTPTKTSVHTFTTVTVPASFHWRTIQASFGAFFPANNPWLMCVSYYGGTVGHSGTWVTYSTDGGTTWSAEVQISVYYGSAPNRFNPIGVYTSPKTPGLAYTVAYGEGAADPDKLPIWCNWSVPSVSGNYTGPQVSATITSTISLGSDETEDDGRNLVMIPPANTVRVVLAGTWMSSYTIVDVGGEDVSFGLSLDKPASITQVHDMVYDTPDVVPPDDSDTNSGSFSLTWTYGGGGDWPVNRTSIITNPLIAEGNPAAARVDITLNGNSEVGETLQSAETAVTLTVTEIEFDGGIIYNPPAATIALFRTTDWGATWTKVTGFIDAGEGFAGSLHLPWPLNADEQLAYYGHFDASPTHQFRLKKIQGSTVTDISPVASAINYGVNYGSFGVRTYDNDKTYVAVGGYGNDTTASTAGDMVGLWVSINAGTAWTNILTPVAASHAQYGLQIAFGGDDRNVLFAWGGKSDSASIAAIYYSSNFGTTLDSREGNMNSLGVTALIGIAGGPTG